MISFQPAVIMSSPEHGVPSCANPGNAVFSCMIKPGSHTSSEEPALARSQDLMYKTTSSDYGTRSPTFESSPCSYHPIYRASHSTLDCGMFQDNSFNTSLDHRYVYIPNYNTQFKGEWSNTFVFYIWVMWSFTQDKSCFCCYLIILTLMYVQYCVCLMDMASETDCTRCNNNLIK